MLADFFREGRGLGVIKQGLEYLGQSISLKRTHKKLPDPSLFSTYSCVGLTGQPHQNQQKFSQVPLPTFLYKAVGIRF